MFVDIAKISVAAGDGGDGAVSFHREKYVAAGGPDGGDGGKGGDIVFVADDHSSTLSDYRYQRKFRAENGENGRAKRSFGKSGKNMVLKVPRGTLVKEAESGRIVADISSNEPQIIAKGGRGGWGNSHFATATRQIPRFSKPGLPGEKLELQLELKLLADVGLLGFPNVGKSTLLSVVSEAKPEIANYHFTTINPILGVVRLFDQSFVLADIPGIIEGAGQGVGLGHQFLRHVDRCRMLIHVVDISGSEGRDPKTDFETIMKEAGEYSAELPGKPMIVAGNKADLASEEQIADFKTFVTGKGYAFFPIMAAIGEGVDALLRKTIEMLSKLPPVVRYEPEPAPVPEIDQTRGRPFTVTVKDGVYLVEAEWLLPIMRVADFNDYESLQYFQRTLISSGIIDALKEKGVQQGDTVSIYDFEFDFVL